MELIERERKKREQVCGLAAKLPTIVSSFISSLNALSLDVPVESRANEEI